MNTLENKINNIKHTLPDNPIKDKNDLYKDILNDNDKMSRNNKTFSGTKNEKNSTDKNNLSIEYNFEKKNNIKNNNSKEKTKKLYFNSSNKSTQTKNIIYSIERENIILNLKRRFQGSNKYLNNKDIYKEKNKNTAIKLIKNKIQNINNSNLIYIKERAPTLSLYKEYYDKKLKKQKEEEKLDELIKIPKRVSPAFGKTAYSKFNKEKNEIDLKKYNPNMNIIIDNNIDEYLNKNKYLYSINGTINHLFKCKSNKRSKINKDDDNINLSI